MSRGPRHGTRGLAALAATFLLTAALAPPANAYVRTRTSRGNPIAWKESCVFLVPPLEVPAGLTENGVLGALQAAMDHWTDVAASYLRFVMDPAEAGHVAEYREQGGNKNVVVFIEQGWPHEAEAAALTTITYLASSYPSEDGRIIDTDVEVNADGFQFTTTGQPGAHDLENVLTHELGHALGLDHTCDDGLVTPTPEDDTGTPIPSCFPLAQLSQEIRESTMFNYAEPGELSKRSLEPDDIAGITAIYPAASDPGVCAPPDISIGPDCNCTSGGPVGPGTALPWLLVLAFLTLRLRRGTCRARRARRAAG